MSEPEPEPITKRCGTCHVFKSLDCFHKSKNKVLGRHQNCKMCRAHPRPSDLLRKKGLKHCIKCDKILKLAEFYGHHSECKECTCQPLESVKLKEQGLKRCGKCKHILALTCFHSHNRAAKKNKTKGYHGWCKKCRKIETKIYFLKNREKLSSQKKIAELKRPEQIAANRKRARLKYIETNPYKTESRRQTRFAIRNGLLPRKPCKICGNPISEAHHADYSKPLEVDWMCRKHHRAWHRVFSTVSSDESK